MHWAWHREILLGRGKADREEPPNKGAGLPELRAGSAHGQARFTGGLTAFLLPESALALPAPHSTLSEKDQSGPHVSTGQLWA